MGKFSSLVLGAVTGAAAALFVQSKKGQEVTKQAKDFYSDYQADPEATKEKVGQAANEFGKNVSQKVEDFKEGVKSGDITFQTVVEDVRNFSEKQVEILNEKLNSKDGLVGKVKEMNSDDIIIEMEEVAEENVEEEILEEVVSEEAVSEIASHYSELPQSEISE